MRLSLPLSPREEPIGPAAALPPASAVLQLVLIQPTPFCNIDCRYCYLPNRSDRRVISAQVLERVGHNVFRTPGLADRVTFLWHAGEPLVLPVSFYEAAFATLARANPTGHPVIHAIQTNGTLLSQAWCDFVRKHRVNLGVSLDGPAFLHDAQRRTRSGAGTQARVMEGVRLLQRNDIEFHVICVLTRDHLRNPDAVFEFFVENGISRVGFNVEEVEGVHASSTLECEDAVGQYRAFLTRMRALCTAHPGALRVREFEQLADYIEQEETWMERNIQVVPLKIVCIDCDGNFSTFSPELLGLRSAEYGDFLLGNVRTDTFESVYEREKFRRLYADVEAGVMACQRSCPYFALCGGGAPANKYAENGSFRSTETLYCRLSRKVLIDVMLADLESRLGLGDHGGPSQGHPSLPARV